jgi:hypothetical protein
VQRSDIEYVALSYTRGTGAEKHPIFIGDKILKTNANLEEAFRELREDS